MVCRLYLVLRWIASHSAIYKHCFLLAVAPMNGVKFGMSLMAKSYLKRSPYTVLLCLSASVIVTLSWALTVKEVGEGNKSQTFAECVWITCIAALGVGYGEKVSE